MKRVVIWQVQEKGIGNTTTSSAVISVLTCLDPETVTGKGAGLDNAGLKRKIEVIKEGIRIHRPDPSDGIDVLSKVGGLDLAALAGFYLGCAYWRIPVVLDGLITGAAALAAVKICPRQPVICWHPTYLRNRQDRQFYPVLA